MPERCCFYRVFFKQSVKLAGAVCSSSDSLPKRSFVVKIILPVLVLIAIGVVVMNVSSPDDSGPPSNANAQSNGVSKDKVDKVDKAGKEHGHSHGDGHNHSHGDGHSHAAAPGSGAGSSHAVHPHGHELKNKDGSWKYTNKLVGESSPYLLQHAHNPVDWYPWGKEAFEKAQKEGKLIFLSIGYSTCYWCHVMERLVFENPAIAKVMNELFVNVKVDREERPDVDDIYMSATQLYSQMTTGRASGGWPMSVFLTPPGAAGKTDSGLKPILAGTYFPPTSQYGRPGFPDLCKFVDKAWKEQRPNLLKQADQIASAVKESLSQQTPAGEVHRAFSERTVELLMGNYDSTHGGFGGTPKFPTPNNLIFLMKAYKSSASPDPELWKAISYTLERMARGGMYDQIGGGFHRYSVDEKWLVPHFEKMLYDNGQLVEVYLMAQSIQPDAKDPELYPRVVREILDYVLREMLDETGTFWSAQDAEVDAKEGGNYVWVEQEVRQAVKDEKLASLALKLFGVDQGTNFKDPHHPNASPVNVLFLPTRLDAVAKAEGISLDQLLEARSQISKQMMAVRDKRKQPRMDDKVLTSWNGLMIAGFARAGRDLKEPRYTQAAARAADYILKNMRNKDGGLFRTMRKGKAKIPGFLEDYSYFVHGLLQLYQSDKQAKWLEAAEVLSAYAKSNFEIMSQVHSVEKPKPVGGYYDTLANQSDLFVRSRTTYDGATPSGNSVAVNNLLALYKFTEKETYLDQAVLDLSSFSVGLRRQGTSMANMLTASLEAIALAPDRFPKSAFDAASKSAEPTQGNPVVVSLDNKAIVVKDGVGAVAVTIKIHKSFHANANPPGAEGVIPVTVKLSGIKGVLLDVTYPKGEQKKFAFADKPISVYEGTVEIKVTLKKDKDAKIAITGAPSIVVGYQVCTDKACLLPAEAVLPITITGLE